MKVLIAGATGLIGNHLLHSLIDDNHFTEITILVRQEIEMSHFKVNQIVFNYENDKEYAKLPEYDAIFCCLGTTIKKAKSKRNFTKVDYEYPKKLAELVKTKKYLLVSSMGADAKSLIFYSRTKGLLEKSLTEMNLNALHIFRPSQLGGNRKEFRLGEQISDRFMRLFDTLIPSNFKLIKAKTVAEAMKIKSLGSQKGTHIYLSGDITQIVENEN